MKFFRILKTRVTKWYAALTCKRVGHDYGRWFNTGHLNEQGKNITIKFCKRCPKTMEHVSE